MKKAKVDNREDTIPVSEHERELLADAETARKAWEHELATQLADMRRGYQALDCERLRHKAESDRRRELLSRAYMFRERGLPQGVAADIASELNGYLSDVYQAPATSAPLPGEPDLELLASRFLGRYGQPYLDWELRDLVALLREVAARA